MTTPIEPANSAETLVEPSRSESPVSKRTVGAFLGAYVGAFLVLIVPIASTLALKVAEVAPDSREASLGVISAIGAFAALVANPIFGALSDRTTSRFGMRRPWVLGGAIVGFAAVLVLASAPNVLVVGLAWTIVQLAMNAVLSGLAAFLPDRVPEQQRGKVSAFTGVAQQLAPFIGLLVANVAFGFGGGLTGMFIVPSALGLALIVLYVLTTRDRVLSPNLRQSFRISTVFKAFAFNPRRNPDFAWAWLGRFLIVLAFAANSTYQVYFLNERLGIPLEQAALYQLGLAVLSAVLLTISASVSGAISDRLKRRKVFVFIASGLVAAGSLITAFSFELPVYLIAAAVTAIATGTYFAVDLALVTDVLPNKETAAAKDMGIFNIANALPQSLAPALAPLLLSIGGGGNYTALFIGAAIVAVLGALTVVPIKKVR
ncbi:MFS transporter [Naasia sp. SYSU D00057]|uniref:MFS transporter n=1 Tax=Naasia sp. SYSU D00057 TaxID=2817380 RepID=UPI001B3058A9|nr:MFS transporter [Naasia sp. SYSU D00057]